MKNIIYSTIFLIASCFGVQKTQAQCHIFDMVATPGDCVNSGFFVTINFQYSGVGSEGFKVQGGGVQFGTFQYDDLPITLGPFPGNGTTVYEFLAKDVLHPDCSDFATVGPINCGGGDCQILDFVATPGDCNNAGNYPLTINFQVNNPPHTHFDVIYQGQSIGYFALADLPVTILNFNDNGQPGQSVKVCINDSDCCAIDEFTAPDCGPSSDCHIYDVIAEAHPCLNNTGQYMLDVAFTSENTGGQGFKIRANNQWFGPFAYGQPHYTIGPLNSVVVYEIVVRDVANENCKGVMVFGPVNCGGGDCHIYDLTAEASDCNNLGQFFVTIDFQHENTGNGGFKVYGNGNVYGYFSYDDLPVTIGPLTSNNEQLEFGVADVNHPSCHDFAVVQVPDCNGGGGGDCHIFELVADVHPCLPNGTFYVTLNFQHENTSGYFKVKGNGVTYGVYSYAELPVEIGPLVGNGTTPFEFLVVDIHNEDCRDDISIGTIGCNNTGDCEVYNLIVDPSDCNADDSYNLWIWFQTNHPGNNFYEVYHNGVYLNHYPLTQVPKTLLHLVANDEPLQTLKICINDQPDCCMTIHYEAPNCDGLVWPGDSNRDNACNHFDILNLGLAFGLEGPSRAVQGIEWTGLAAQNWPSSFGNGVNVKNADCTGDGKVNQIDLAAVFLNFGETHGEPQPVAFVKGNENDPPLFVDLPSAAQLQPGMTFQAPIMLGTADAPLSNAYGVAFTLKFDPTIINPASIAFQYDPSWLGVQQVNLLTFDHLQPSAGEVKVALVRTDQNNVSGFGQIAGIIGIIDNIAGKESVSIEITDVKAIRENEALISLRTPIETVSLTVDGSNEPKEPGLVVFPNPVGEMVYFNLPNGATADFAELQSVDGKRLLFDASGDNKLNVSQLGAGFYILQVKSGDRVYQQKIVK